MKLDGKDFIYAEYQAVDDIKKPQSHRTLQKVTRSENQANSFTKLFGCLMHSILCVYMYCSVKFQLPVQHGHLYTSIAGLVPNDTDSNAPTVTR